MKSRNYAGISLLASLAACNSATAETVQKNSTQAPQKPNVIVILADDLGYGDLKCYGAKNVETPHVDKLASEGIRFTNAHTVAATSTPSRYSLLTGEYAWRRPDTIMPRTSCGSRKRTSVLAGWTFTSTSPPGT